MTKRVALLENGLVVNIIMGNSAAEIATLFNCEAVEVTDETLQAYIGYGMEDGKFIQRPLTPEEIAANMPNPPEEDTQTPTQP